MASRGVQDNLLYVDTAGYDELDTVRPHEGSPPAVSILLDVLGNEAVELSATRVLQTEWGNRKPSLVIRQHAVDPDPAVFRTIPVEASLSIGAQR